MVAKTSDDSTLKPFIREKLFLAIYQSCKHRPQATLDSASLTQTVINDLIAHGRGGRITRQHIIDSVLAVLSPYDKVAATVYSAYHS
jgi:transcriptional regulator NrdR family protein